MATTSDLGVGQAVEGVTEASHLSRAGAAAGLAVEGMGRPAGTAVEGSMDQTPSGHDIRVRSVRRLGRRRPRLLRPVLGRQTQGQVCKGNPEAELEAALESACDLQI